MSHVTMAKDGCQVPTGTPVMREDRGGAASKGGSRGGGGEEYLSFRSMESRDSSEFPSA